MKTTTRTAAAIVAGALLLAGCGSSGDGAADDTTTTKAEATTTAPAELEITDVWARQSPMGTSAGAIYLEITSPIDDELVGASVPTDVAGTTEIHETVMADDAEGEMGDDEMTTTTEAMGDATTTTAGDMAGEMDGEGTDDGGMDGESMTMQQVESIELPAGETVALEPGGYHVMLLDLVEPLEVGQTIELTLSFQMAGDRTVTAEVREG